MSDLDLATATACEVVAALRVGMVSSVELLDAFIDRHERLNPAHNAVVASDFDRARREAVAADAARTRGVTFGALAGLPMTLKDTYETEGLVTTAGAPALAGHNPAADADVTQALRRAGAIVHGKTNVPLYAGDHQTFNDVYGITNNPWDVSRTVGGSSGGAAAALALGLTVAEVGSDIGGSIRLPAHFNGVFGLKPTHGVVSGRGHIPGPPGTLAPDALSVCGPMGRSVADLELLLDVLVSVGSFGGVPGAALPEPVAPVDPSALRVAVWGSDPVAPVDSATSAAVDSVAEALRSAGAVVHTDLRPGPSSEDLHDTYLKLLLPVMGMGLPARLWDAMDERSRASRNDADADGDPGAETVTARYMTSSHKSWVIAQEEQHRAMASWAALFESVDVVVAPVGPTAAFPHNIDRSYWKRVVDVDGRARPYSELLFWAGLATMPLQPAVVIPVDRTGDGLPVGVQLIGPRWSDRRLLAIAKTIGTVVDSRFEPPPVAIA